MGDRKPDVFIDGRAHFVGEDREHILSVDCWCNPVVEEFDMVGDGEIQNTIETTLHRAEPILRGEPGEVAAMMVESRSITLTALPDESRDLIVECLERLARIEVCWLDNEHLARLLRGNTIWIEES